MITFLGKNKMFSNEIMHRIENGQTFEDISKIYNIPIDALKANNKEEIYDGQCVILCGFGKKYHIVKPAETLETIAQKYNTTKQSLKQKNSAQQIFVGQLLEI